MSITRPPRITNAVSPPRKMARFTLHNIVHHRDYAPLREVAGYGVLALATLVVAYMWVGAADPLLP